jgi:serpin B
MQFMQRKRLVPWLIFALGLTFAGAPTFGESPEPRPPAGSLAKLARSSNAFGFDLYQRLRTEPGNLVLSPASITTVLTMAWGGAGGETAAQMRKMLHLEGTPDEVMATAGQLARSLQVPGRPVVFRIANELFSEATYPLVPAYLKKTSAAFGAAVEPLDFKGNPERARVHINQWVEGKTANRIQNLIPPGGVGPDSRLVLVNAIYFLGEWAEMFGRAATRPAPFHVTAATMKDVPTMNNTREVSIGHQDGVTALALPYKGGAMSMMLLVPDAVEGLAAVEDRLDSKMIDRLNSALKQEWVGLSLPLFEVNPAGGLALAETLEALGMRLAFDPRLADFTGIAKPARPTERLVIGNVFHKGFVKVDEQGTEAAAATEMSIPTGARAEDTLPRQLRVDRPFLFLIRDDASGLVLFLGRVSDPSRR